MADTITTNYHWVKPEISGSPTTWGVKLNADLNSIDTTLHSVDVQSAASAAELAIGIVPVGAMFIWPSLDTPTNYLVCDGTIYNISAYPELASLLGSTFGGNGTTTFGVPLMNARIPVGYETGQSIGTELQIQRVIGTDLNYIFMNFIIRAL